MIDTQIHTHAYTQSILINLKYLLRPHESIQFILCTNWNETWEWNIGLKSKSIDAGATIGRRQFKKKKPKKQVNKQRAIRTVKFDFISSPWNENDMFRYSFYAITNFRSNLHPSIANFFHPFPWICQSTPWITHIK